MKNISIHILIFISVLLPIQAAENFSNVTLPKGVSVELPKNWIIMSQDHMMTIDALAQSISEKLDSFDASTDLAFGAGYIFAGKSAAIFNIRYYPKASVSQKESKSLSDTEIKELDNLIENGIKESGKHAGYSVPDWLGTEPQTINGIHTLVSEYTRRSDGQSENFHVRLVRVLNGKKTFLITISYRDSLEGVLRPICDRVINSITI